MLLKFNVIRAPWRGNAWGRWKLAYKTFQIECQRVGGKLFVAVILVHRLSPAKQKQTR